MEDTKKGKFPLDLDNGDTLFHMFDYLCSKVNWGDAALDNDGINCMNILFRELRKDERLIKP